MIAAMSAVATTPISTGAVPKKNLKSSEVEKWEIDCIGGFLLQLYHSKVITPQTDWYVPKQTLREEFRQFLRKADQGDLKEKFEELNGTADVGSLLFRTKYLINTPRGSDHYHIKSAALFQYRNRQLEILDDMCINGESRLPNNPAMPFSNGLAATGFGATTDAAADPALASCFEVDESAKVYPIKYVASKLEDRQSDFRLTNMGCYICQRNFNTNDQFEQHVEEHSDESDYKLLATMKKFSDPFIKLSYQLCKKSHYFCFTLQTSLSNVVIEKIIIVQSRSFYYVPKSRVPFALPANGKSTFFVDSHLFTINLEQAIVIVFHPVFSQYLEKRIVEQHHFVRKEEFPEASIATNPWRLPNAKTFKPKFALPQYLPPNEVCRALKNEYPLDQLFKLSNEFRDYYCNEKRFSAQNLRQAMNLLVQVEDMDMIYQYKKLVQRNVTLKDFENEFLLKLVMPDGIYIEDVLSLFDEVLIIAESNQNNATFNPTSMDDNVIMEMLLKNTDDLLGSAAAKKVTIKPLIGKVVKISNLHVTFVCDQKIPKDKTYAIVFRPGRLPLRYQYRALQQFDVLSAGDINRLLFPQNVMHCNLPLPSLDLKNRRIYENPEQLQAVRNIAEGPQSDATYIIFGPPGTGKTTTIVEAILQLYMRRPYTKILVTAGSNSACDEIALRLCQTITPKDTPRALVRIYSRANERRSDNIDDNLLESSNMYALHFFPDVEVLHEYRIVICTLSIVGKLATGKFGKDDFGNGLFTHIFIDEAAASTEAEALVGIMGVFSTRASLILSGDHKQLGPVLHSSRAQEFGLGVSLMERLLARDCYSVKDGHYNHSIQTRLCRNYRSHPEIVNLYSGMYYNNELIPLASSDVALLGRNWHRLPNPNFPILFHAINGNSFRGKNSVSLCNPQEVEVVLDFVKDLMYFGINGKRIKQTDIGIISPYKKQYQRIQEELNLRNWYDIETGSVELFQGKEKPIIIVSFVRSNTTTLGFLENPRRLNVTLSRAKSLLVLVGNARTLSMNAEFKHIINECRRHNNIVGCEQDRLLRAIEPINGRNNNNTNNNNVINQNGNNEKKPVKKYYGKKKNKSNGANTENDRPNSNANGKTVTPAAPKQHNEHQQLRQPMKKRVQPMGQQKRVKAGKTEVYKSLLLADIEFAEDAGEELISNKSEIDALFEQLPAVPKSKENVQQQTVIGNDSKSNRANVEQDLKKLEKDIHASMLKLRLKPPTPGSSTVIAGTASQIQTLPQTKNAAPQQSVNSPRVAINTTQQSVNTPNRTDIYNTQQSVNSPRVAINTTQQSVNPPARAAINTTQQSVNAPHRTDIYNTQQTANSPLRVPAYAIQGRQNHYAVPSRNYPSSNYQFVNVANAAPQRHESTRRHSEPKSKCIIA